MSENKAIDAIGELTQDEINLVLEHRTTKGKLSKQERLLYECIKTLSEWAVFLAQSKKQPTRAVFFNEFGYKPPIDVNSSDVFRIVNKSLGLVKKMVGLGGVE